MVARAQWLFRFVKVMFGRNAWLVMGGMVKKVRFSEGCMGGGVFVIGSVFAIFCCGWYGHVRHR